MRIPTSILGSIAAILGVASLSVPAFASNHTPDSFEITVEGEIEAIEVTQNEPFSVSVEALLASLDTATGYTGSIIFSSSDTSATLPSESAFTAADEGIKDFDQAVTLVTLGTQTLRVTDADDNSITGEVTVTVVGSDGDGGDEGAPVITAPTDGTTINTATVTIAGEADPFAAVTILDGTEELGTADADADGLFTFETPDLFSGTHTFTATVDDGGTTLTSASIRVVVDTLGATISNVLLVPETTGPAGIVAITVDTEAGLPVVEAIVDQQSYTLAEDAQTPGIYTGEIVAPDAMGTYQVAIRVTDESANQRTSEDEATLTVSDLNQPPTVTISANTSGGIAPLPVSFTSVATDPDGFIQTYAWDFGDGATSSEENPQHTYAVAGSYSVTLTVTDDSGASTLARLATNIAVATPPITTGTGPGTWFAVTLMGIAGCIAYALRRRVASPTA